MTGSSVANMVHIHNSDTPLAAAARLEAMMTFKQRQIGSEESEFVFLHPRVVKSKEQAFNFGRIFEIMIGELESGQRQLPREIEEMFA